MKKRMFETGGCTQKKPEITLRGEGQAAGGGGTGKKARAIK
jgi:hypothetical protein